jgi:Leucine-rich repeat (LRR) protein
MNKILLIILIVSTAKLAVAQDLVFKDTNFLKAVLTYKPKIDRNRDGIIQRKEADAVKELNLMEKNIHSAEDAYLFPNLESLVLTNNQITRVRLVGLKSLKEFYCAVNQVQFAEIRDVPKLTDLHFNFNKFLDTLILEQLPELGHFSADDNKIKSFEATAFPKLQHLSLRDNQLKSLDVTKNPELIQVSVSGNPLKELDISFNKKMITHILYVDPSVKLITTPEQKKAIDEKGLGVTFIEQLD